MTGLQLLFWVFNEGQIIYWLSVFVSQTVKMRWIAEDLNEKISR